MIEWLVSRAGKVRGPFSEPEMFELIGRRKVIAGDLLSVDGGGRWFPIEQSPQFSPSLPSPSVPPPQPVYQYPFPAPGYAPPHYAPAPLAPRPWTCPRCQSDRGTYLTTKTTTAGWVMFFIGLFTCVLFPLVFIGLSQKENVMFCKNCRCRL